MNESDTINEGLKETAIASILAMIFAIPGVVSADSVEKVLKNTKYTRSNSTNISKILEYATTEAGSGSISKTYSGYTFFQAVDILARTLYSEAADQGHDGRLAVMSIIWNRSGGDTENIIPVVFRKGQFCGWNREKPSIISGKYSPSEYEFYIPAHIIDKNSGRVSRVALAAWNDCREIAANVLSTGKFTSTIGNCNMIINPAKDNRDFYNYWKDKTEFTVGDHKFAYDKMYDGFSKSVKTTTTTTTTANQNTDAVVVDPSLAFETIPYEVSIDDYNDLEIIASKLINSKIITYTTDPIDLAGDIYAVNKDIIKMDPVTKKYIITPHMKLDIPTS